MKNTFSKVKHAAETSKGKVALAVGAVIVGSTNAMAAIPITGEEFVFIDTAYYAVVAIMLSALGGFWIAKKILSLAGK